MTTTAAPWLPDRVRQDWDQLSRPTVRPAAFDPSAVADLPGPARRWLSHAIRPGTPLLQSVELTMHGELRVDAWRRFTASQVVAPPKGFVWAATVRVSGMPITGFDRYSAGSGQMRWRLLGLVPVMSATGPDVSRSAAGRLAGEFIFVPGLALTHAVEWEPVDEQRTRARVTIGGIAHAITMSVAPSGSLQSITMLRWGSPDKRPYRVHIFGAEVHDEATFDGFTVPVVVTAGWWYGTDRWSEGKFIRFTVDRAAYR